MYITQFKAKVEGVIERYESSLMKLNASGASPSMLNSVMVDYHGEMMPLNSVASLKVQDALNLLVVPFEHDKKVSMAIISGIGDADLGLSASDEGSQIRVPVPAMDGEKRIRYVKEAKEIAENAKVQLRKVRQDIFTKLKKDESLSEDNQRDEQNNLQKEVDEVNKKIEDILSIKETELSSV